MNGNDELKAINEAVDGIRVLKERLAKLEGVTAGRLLLFDHSSQTKFLLNKEQQVAVINLVRNDINRQIEVQQSLLRNFGFSVS
jgi:hypothetical protein